jgi:hypothetical protein
MRCLGEGTSRNQISLSLSLSLSDTRNQISNCVKVVVTKKAFVLLEMLLC